LGRTDKAVSLGIASLIVIALILIAGFGAFLGTILNSQQQTTSQPTIAGNASRMTITQGDWRFTSTINGTTFTNGERVNLNSALTYIGTRDATVRLAGPILVFQISADSGSAVYSWQPSGTISSYKLTPGESFYQPVAVSTQGWRPGQYTVLVYPEIFQQNNFTLSRRNLLRQPHVLS
jgi:hypothetical protein